MKIIVSPSFVSAFNLAAEEYFFLTQEKNLLLLYRNNPSVIIGSNQAVLNEVDMDFCIDHHIPVIRRLSGGGAVYHDRGNFNYAFIRDKGDTPLSAAFLEPIVKVLHHLGIPAEIGRRKDLWLEGRKMSGTASHISRGRELHHGTLLYDTDLEMLQHALSAQNKSPIQKATASVRSPVTNIRSYLSAKRGEAPARETFFDLFHRELLSFFGTDDWTLPDPAEIAGIEVLQESKYTQRSWNYRM
jgi:lipoate-protein ligase A